jgi:hypothetical protein
LLVHFYWVVYAAGLVAAALTALAFLVREYVRRRAPSGPQ